MVAVAKVEAAAAEGEVLGAGVVATVVAVAKVGDMALTAVGAATTEDVAPILAVAGLIPAVGVRATQMAGGGRDPAPRVEVGARITLARPGRAMVTKAAESETRSLRQPPRQRMLARRRPRTPDSRTSGRL